jgi:hypothetical protein
MELANGSKSTTTVCKYTLNGQRFCLSFLTFCLSFLVFENVTVSTLDENGVSKPKHPEPVNLLAEYDPEVSLTYEVLFLLFIFFAKLFID